MREPRSGADKVRIWVFYALCAVIFGFLFLPSVAVIPLSFNSEPFLTYPIKGFSLRWYRQFFVDERWLFGLYHSAAIACAATVIATVLGTLAALGLERLAWVSKQIARAVFLLPLVVPVVVTGSSLYLMFSPLGLTSTFVGVILGHSVLAVPFVVIIVTATLQGMDINLIRAALSLGASPPVVFYRVTLPLILPGVFSGAVFAFATSFDEIIITRLLAGPAQRTLPLQMFSGVRENLTPTITAAATILVLISVVLLALAELLRRHMQKARMGT